MTDNDDRESNQNDNGCHQCSEVRVDVDPREVVHQADALFDVYDNISKVIGKIDFPIEKIPDKYDPERLPEDTFPFESMLRVYLYKKISGHSQIQTAKRLEKWPYLQQRFGLDRAPSQQDISYAKRDRFYLCVRQFLQEVADGIREIAESRDIRSSEIAYPDDPNPNEVAASDQPLYEYVDEYASDIISELVDTLMPAFDTGRDHTTQYNDQRVWEQQALMSLTDRSGTPSAYRTFNKFHTDRPHNDTHVRAVKKLGTPDNHQYTFDDFTDSDRGVQRTPEWRRTTDTIQSQFNGAVERMLGLIDDSDAYTEPAVAAIDVTGVQFFKSLWKGKDDIEPDDERMIVNGKEKVPKDDYPKMVNGTQEDDVYEYQYATLTIVSNNVPLILAVEPVRHHSIWESEDGRSVPWAEVVDRLMEQATDLVDIDLVMADKAFDQHGVFHVLDQRHDVDYLIPKKEDSEHLRGQAEEVRDDPAVTARVEQDAALHLRDNTPYIDTESDPDVDEDNYSHDVTFIHVPADRNDWIIRNADDTGYALFATNRDNVTPMDAEDLTNRYSHRWDVENEYRMVLPMVPSIASKDYRMRFFSFVFSTLLYNLWRIVDHSLKEIASEAYDDYGRGPHEDRLDPILTLADFLGSSLILMIIDGLDPPDRTV